MKFTQQEFIELIKNNKGIIYKICTSYCADKDSRDDLAQEIIYNMWKSIGSYKEAYKFSTWMYRVALNVAISFYRSEKKFSNHTSISDGLIVFEDDSDMEVENNLRLLQGFINELKEIDKAIILLYLDDKPYREIAEITGFTETNVATKINRIKEKLKTKFSTN